MLRTYGVKPQMINTNTRSPTYKYPEQPFSMPESFTSSDTRHVGPKVDDDFFRNDPSVHLTSGQVPPNNEDVAELATNSSQVEAELKDPELQTTNCNAKDDPDTKGNEMKALQTIRSNGSCKNYLGNTAEEPVLPDQAAVNQKRPHTRGVGNQVMAKGSPNKPARQTLS